MIHTDGGCNCPSLGRLGFESTASDPASIIASVCAGSDPVSCQATIDYYASQVVAAGSGSGTPTAGQLIPGVSNTYIILGAMAVIAALVLSKG